MARHENLSVNALVTETIVNAAGSNLLTSNTLATDKMYVGVANVATAKTQAEVRAHLLPFYVVLCDEYTTAGGAASEAITVTGAVAATDFAFVTLTDDGTANVTIKSASITGADTVTVVFSGNPGNDAKVNIMIVRPTA